MGKTFIILSPLILKFTSNWLKNKNNLKKLERFFCFCCLV
jgi:hypothetical protein